MAELPQHNRTRALMEGKVPKVPNEEQSASAETVVAENNDPAAAQQQTAAQQVEPKNNFDDLTDDQLTEILAKRTGRTIKSLDELKEAPPAPKVLTAKEQEDLIEQEKAESLEWALGTKKISRDLYDKSIVERSKNKRDIALMLFTEEAKAENKDLTDDECAEMFSDEYFEHEEENSSKRKRALARMNATADNYLAQYSVIDNLPEEYRSYKTTADNQKTYDKQVRAVSKEVPTELSFKIPYTSVDGAQSEIEYKVPVDDKVMTGIVKEFSTADMYYALSQGGEKPIKPEMLAGEINYHLQARMFSNILANILTQHEAKVEEDIMVKLTNSRNPNQPFTGQINPTATKTAPPEHTRTKAATKNK